MSEKFSQLTLHLRLAGSDIQQYLNWRNDAIRWTLGPAGNENGLMVHPGLGNEFTLTGTARMSFNQLAFDPWPAPANFIWVQSVEVPADLFELKFEVLIPGGWLWLVTDAGSVKIKQPQDQTIPELSQVPIT